MFRNREVFALIIFLSIIFGVALKGLAVIEEESRAVAGNALRTVVRTVEESLLWWLEGRLQDVHTVASREGLVSLTHGLLERERNGQDLVGAGGLQMGVREFLAPYLGLHADLGFFIISPDRINIGSMSDSSVGIRSLIDGQSNGFLDLAFAGENGVISVIDSGAPVSTNGHSSMAVMPRIWAVSPIRDANKGVIAVLAVELDALRQFGKLVTLGRIGKSGESYVFDRGGHLLTASRFEPQLQRIGLLRPSQGSALNIRVADPGVDLTKGFRNKLLADDRPHTVLVREALKNAPGVATTGYPDYRGVPVLGAWTWMNGLDVGLATEIDEDEALKPFYIARDVMLGSMGIAALLSILLSIYLSKARGKALAALEKSRAVLENRVQERTESLFKTNQRLQDQVEERLQAQKRLKIAHERLEESNVKLEKLATVDGLTEIPNRRSFDHALRREWQRCQREEVPISIALLDVDFFKLYNDSLGHQAGDRCLKQIGNILGNGGFTRRPGDIAARYGGEEFALVLGGTPAEEALRIAENIRKAVFDAQIPHPETRVEAEKSVTVSIGVATVIPAPPLSPYELVSKVDRALYSAKDQGRNRAVVASWPDPLPG